MLDLCLKFADEAEAKSVLYRLQPVVEQPRELGQELPSGVEAQWVPNYRNIDTIGLIYKPTGTMLTGEFGEYPEMAPVEGWHVNVLVLDSEDAAPLQAFVVEPAQRLRVWA